MPIVYPGDPPGSELDVFNVPTEPEGTPLSSAGTSTRNHTELHDDTASAVETLQDWASIRTHDHSGASPSRAHGPKLIQANTHQSPDTDTAPTALHHTLGKGANQAAFGNHIHDYTSPEITNKPFEICTSTNRPDPFPGKVIWEVDTNRMRVWAQFEGQDTTVQGLYSTDTFQRFSNTNIGPSLWEQTYISGDLTHGLMAIPDGNAVSWIEAGTAVNRCIARRINAADQYTETDDQVVTFNTNEHVMDWDNPGVDNPASNDVYLRMSDDGQEYVRAALTWWKGATGALMLLATDSGPGGEQLIGQLPAASNTPNILWQFRLIGNKFEAWMGITKIGEIHDPTGVTLNGNKGWGFGMQAGEPAFWGTQAIPNEVSAITIGDAPYFTSSAIWQLLPVGDVPRIGLGTSYEQQINPTGSVIEWDVVGEDNFGFYDPALKTAVVIDEPGVYYVHASIVWDTGLLGDHAASVIMVNDQPTPHMHWEFVRGNTYHPGFCQTVDVSAYLRLDLNDRVGIAAAHNGAASQYTGHKKGSEITQVSRFFMCFHSA